MITINYSAGGTDAQHRRNHFLTKEKMRDWVIIQQLLPFVYDVGNGFSVGKPGQILIIPPDMTLVHGPTSDMKVGTSDDWMFFSSDCIRELVDMLKLPLGEAFEVSDGYEEINKKFLDPYIRRMNNECKRSYNGYEVMISSIITEMLVEMSRQRSKRLMMLNPHKQVIEEVRKNMFSNYSLPYTLSELAKRSGYSEVHFSVLYKRFFGASPIEDLIRYRIMIAKEKIKTSNLTMTEISEECGFSSIHYFSRIFKKHVGVSPSEYRNM